MDDNRQLHFKSLRQRHQRRLNVLEQKAAIMGINTPAETTLEIEDIKKQLTQIDAEEQEWIAREQAESKKVEREQATQPTSEQAGHKRPKLKETASDEFQSESRRIPIPQAANHSESINVLGEQIQALRGRPPRDYSGLLDSLVDYFDRVVPSAVDIELILYTEEMLNELRISCRGRSGSEAQKAVKHALALASTLSHSIRASRANQYKRDFFENVSELGYELRRVRLILPE